jgi:hypothetical protein
MNNEEQDKVLEAILNKVSKIDDALLGTYDKKGFITRLRNVERVMKYLGGVVITTTTIVTTVLIKNLMGMGG